MISLPTPSDENLKRIFGSIVKGFFDAFGFNEETQNFGKKMVNAAVDLYARGKSCS